MNRYLKIGLAAAAVLVVAVVGFRQFGASNVGSPGPTATPTVTPTVTPTATPLPSVAGPSTAIGGLPEGPFLINGTDGPVQVTVDIAASGWQALDGLDAVSKDDDSLDPPETVGAALLAWAWPAGTGFNVYGDPCHWSTTISETPATTPDEIAVALAAQASSDPTAPMDVTVGGHAGKAITLHVPMSYDIPGASREEQFADCDQSVFGFYAAEGDTEPTRNAQGAGQIDELWILDVDGTIVILDAAYSPATPVDLVDEMRTLAESATFAAP